MSSYLQRIDREKRRDWKEFYARSTHPEHEIKNYLIDNIHKICPGFKYLVDFEWEIEEGHPNKGKGDLIFGSDYKTYLTIETKFLHTGSGKTAQVSRHNARRRVKEQAERYNDFATKRFGLEVVDVIGATFTNEDYRIHFLDDDDKRIARSVAKEYQNQFLVFMDCLVSFCIVSMLLYYIFNIFKTFPFDTLSDDPNITIGIKILSELGFFNVLVLSYSMFLLAAYVSRSQRYYIFYFVVVNLFLISLIVTIAYHVMIVLFSLLISSLHYSYYLKRDDPNFYPIYFTFLFTLLFLEWRFFNSCSKHLIDPDKLYL